MNAVTSYNFNFQLQVVSVIMFLCHLNVEIWLSLASEINSDFRIRDLVIYTYYTVRLSNRTIKVLSQRELRTHPNR